MTRRVCERMALVATLVVGAWGAVEAQVPDEFTNLKVLPREIGKKELVDLMVAQSIDLGVRCNHCHVGGDDLKNMDFASDEKATKQAARRMLRMVRSINGETLPALETLSEDEHPTPQAVTCYTCHRGESRPPRRTDRVLLDAVEARGVAGALDDYRELLANHQSDGTYDLRPEALVGVARKLSKQERRGEAREFLDGAFEVHPDSAILLTAAGQLALEDGDGDVARGLLERALAIDPENRGARRGLAALAEAEAPATP